VVTSLFCATPPPPPPSPLFPYTTLFRSADRLPWRRRGLGSRCGAPSSPRKPRVPQGSDPWRAEKAGRFGRCPLRAERCARKRRRSEEHTSELQSLRHLVCRLLLEKKNQE